MPKPNPGHNSTTDTMSQVRSDSSHTSEAVVLEGPVYPSRPYLPSLHAPLCSNHSPHRSPCKSGSLITHQEEWRALRCTPFFSQGGDLTPYPASTLMTELSALASFPMSHTFEASKICYLVVALLDKEDNDIWGSPDLPHDNGRRSIDILTSGARQEHPYSRLHPHDQPTIPTKG